MKWIKGRSSIITNIYCKVSDEKVKYIPIVDEKIWQFI